jgi:hypothetical protein
VWFLLAGLLAMSPYPWLPENLLREIWYDGLAAAGAVAMAVGIRRNRPEWAAGWWLLVAGQAANLLGDLIFYYVENAPDEDGLSRPSDAAYLLGYVFLGTGLLLLLRRRNHGRDRASLIDSMIITSAFALVSWVFLMKPAAEDTSVDLAGQLVGIAYPTLDLLLLALLAWLLTSDGPRNIAFVLLAATMMAFLVGDYFWAFAEQSTHDPGTFGGRLVDCAYLLGYVCFGAGALHPGMTEIGRPIGPDRLRPITLRRLVLLTTATLIAPALLAWQASRDDGRVLDAYAIVAGSVTMFLLVITRMNMLVRQVQSQAVVLEQQADLLHEAAMRDPLTGLPNRRAWNASLQAALQRAARDGAPLALALVDLDHFKSFNDTYGHQAGDRLLKEAAAAWSANLRAVDLLARYGGESSSRCCPAPPRRARWTC